MILGVWLQNGDVYVCVLVRGVLVYRKVRDGRLLVVWMWMQSII